MPSQPGVISRWGKKREKKHLWKNKKDMTHSIHHFQLHNNSGQQTENFCQSFHLWICSFSFLLLLTLHSLILFFNFKQLLHMQKCKAMLFSQQYIPIITNKDATKQHHSTLLLCQQCFDHAQDYHKTSAPMKQTVVHNIEEADTFLNITLTKNKNPMI